MAKITNGFEQMNEIKRRYGKILHATAEIFDDTPCYEESDIRELMALSFGISFHKTEEEREAAASKLSCKLSDIKQKDGAPRRIYLWQDNMPASTEYNDNSDYRFTHDPDFKPYMLEMLISEDITPRGVVICIPGGDHGSTTVCEAYQSALDLNKLGYQCFILHNRVNMNPWSGPECGADVARAIRIIRRDCDKYRIKPNNIAVAGFSNGGLTGEHCIRYYSGKQTVAQHFLDYTPDDLDKLYGAPDAFICVYGPRFNGSDFDYTDVVYPPAFFAVGREDKGAIANLNYTYTSLVEHDIPVEIHTFAGVPHGFAGAKFHDGTVKFPNADTWPMLADSFMQDIYCK